MQKIKYRQLNRWFVSEINFKSSAQRIQEPQFLTTQSPYANFGREKQNWQGQGKRKKPKQK